MMGIEETDRALHEIMTTIWKAYRAGGAEFNSCFAGLHEKYGDDPVCVSLIVDMGLGLAPAIARKERGKHEDSCKK